MTAWKFIIGLEARALGPKYPGVFANQSVTVVIAEDENAARRRLYDWAAQNGHDARWLEVADVRRIELVEGSVLAWAQGF